MHIWILKGMPNGTSEEKKGSKRSLAEERFVSLHPFLPLSHTYYMVNEYGLYCHINKEAKGCVLPYCHGKVLCILVQLIVCAILIMILIRTLSLNKLFSYFSNCLALSLTDPIEAMITYFSSNSCSFFSWFTESEFKGDMYELSDEVIMPNHGLCLNEYFHLSFFVKLIIFLLIFHNRWQI